MKKRKTVNINKEVEKSFAELEAQAPDNSTLLQEITLSDEDSTLEFDVLQDKYDWLAQPLDDWQRKNKENE